MKSASFFVFAISISSLLTSSSMAWDKHQKIMQALVEKSDHHRNYLNQEVKIPCLKEEEKIILEISSQLSLGAIKIPRYSKSVGAENCAKAIKVKVIDLIQSEFIDEPDYGMDQDLPEIADTHHDRDWMGGKTGPTSQGFRHMYFSVPFLRTMGQAPERFEKLKALSEKFFKEGNVFWGLRTRLWALHFMQDLHQPFHTSPIPSLRFVPLKITLAAVTHALANYHYAYEGLILECTKDHVIAGFGSCFTSENPHEVKDILEVVNLSKSQARELGKNLVGIFPAEKLKNKNFDLTRAENPDTLDYYAISNALKNQEALKRVREISCDLLKSLSNFTWGELDQAFKK